MFLSEFEINPINTLNSIIGPLNDSPDLRSYLIFPVFQEVLDILQIVIALHGIRPTIHYPIQIGIIRLMSLLLLDVQLVLQLRLFLIDEDVDVRRFHDKSSQDLPISNHIVRLPITFGFWDGSQNFRKILLRLLWSFGFTRVTSTE